MCIMWNQITDPPFDGKWHLERALVWGIQLVEIASRSKLREPLPLLLWNILLRICWKKSDKLKQLYLFSPQKTNNAKSTVDLFHGTKFTSEVFRTGMKKLCFWMGATPTTPSLFLQITTERYQLFCMTWFCPKTNHILKALAASSVVVLTYEWWVQFPQTLLLEKLVL